MPDRVRTQTARASEAGPPTLPQRTGARASAEATPLPQCATSDGPGGPGRMTPVSISVTAEPFTAASVQRLIKESDAEARIVYADSWDPQRGSTVAAREFEPPAGCFLVARLARSAVACGGFRRLTADAAEIKRLFVSAEVRRQRIATELLACLEELASWAGYRLVRLDTGARQPGALALFQGAGYREIQDYNGNELAAHWFEKQVS
jgi:GNAT superfamily N-acetyltransferase